MFQRRICLALASILLLGLGVTPADARIVPISAASSAGAPRSDSGDGLIMRFADLASGCGIALGVASTDTVAANIATMLNINFLLNTGCTIGPFYHGCGYFATRWDSYLNIKVPGDYIFSMQVDDCAWVTIADSTILRVDGGNWYVNQVSDTVRFVAAGSYHFRSYYSDCQPCCRGFRLGGMGPEGSGLMTFTPGFDFNSDLGPCCTTYQNGPGLSVVPAALFYTTAPVSGVEAPPGALASGITGARVSPNPCAGAAQIEVSLAHGQRVWGEVLDGSGRRVSTLASGEALGTGATRWSWSPRRANGRRGGSGTYFYRFRAEDGSTATGRILVVR